MCPKLCGKVTGNVLDVGCGIRDFVRFRANAIGGGRNVDYCVPQGFDSKLNKDNHLSFADDSFDGFMLDNVLESIPSDMANGIIMETRGAVEPWRQ